MKLIHLLFFGATMIAVAHYRIGGDIDGEYISEF